MRRKISPRARLLLRLIDENTIRDASGKLERFWVPGARWRSAHLRDGTEVQAIGGSGDAAALKALHRAGLTEQPAPTSLRYGYATTAAGHAEAGAAAA